MDWVHPFLAAALVVGTILFVFDIRRRRREMSTRMARHDDLEHATQVGIASDGKMEGDCLVTTLIIDDKRGTYYLSRERWEAMGQWAGWRGATTVETPADHRPDAPERLTLLRLIDGPGWCLECATEVQHNDDGECPRCGEETVPMISRDALRWLFAERGHESDGG
jgi:hypothetical protein